MSLKHKDLEIEYSKLNHSRRMIKIGFVIFALCSIAIIGIMFINIVDQREKEKRQDEIINRFSYENTNLRKEINAQQNQITYLARRNEELLRTQRSRYQEQPKQTYQQPRKKEIHVDNVFKQQEPSINKPAPTIQQNKYTAPKYTEPKKMYQRYGNAKLVSDSKITVMPDNRLKSNMKIYGRYIRKPITSPTCGKNENIYKIVNECSSRVSLFEEIYFKKSMANEVNNFNQNTQMIECLYDYENGVMHDCSVKLIGV